MDCSMSAKARRRAASSAMNGRNEASTACVTAFEVSLIATLPAPGELGSAESPARPTHRVRIGIALRHHRLMRSPAISRRSPAESISLEVDTTEVSAAVAVGLKGRFPEVEKAPPSPRLYLLSK